MATVGGIREVGGFQNSTQIQDLARFAVDEHNKQQNALLSFSGVAKAQEQVVAGTVYYLTIEVKEGDTPRMYEAKVWVKPWENFKQLQGFKAVDQPSITAADLGVKQEGLKGSGWRTVPAHDPAVQEAAERAVKEMQQRSNSLASYELQEVLSAKAEVIEGCPKFDLALKVRRGTKDEVHRVEIQQNPHGGWTAARFGNVAEH